MLGVFHDALANASKKLALHLSSFEAAKARRFRDMVGFQKKAEVEDYAEKNGFTYFLNYAKQQEAKRRQFRSAVDLSGHNLNCASVLDIGPGTSDSLDVALELGASHTTFIDEEPYFYHYGRVKGHSGVLGNYYLRPFFPGEWRGKFDFIYTKGSINCGWVDQQNLWRRNLHIRGYFDFESWVDSVIGMLRSGGCIVLLPSMPRQKEEIFDDAYDLRTFYYCPDVEEYRRSFFVRTLVSKGFRTHDRIDGLTQEKAFPLAFVYRGDRSSRLVP